MDPSPAQRLRALWIPGLALCLLLLSGCFPAPEPPPRFQPGQALYDHYTTPGKRMVVQSPEGPTMKVRTRRATVRVYDEEMRPLGRVQGLANPVEADPVEGEHETRITVLGLGQEPRSVRRISADVVELPGKWRLELADGGWDLFGGDGDLLVLWRRAEDGWIARPRYSTDDSLVIEDEGHLRHLLDPRGRRLLTFPAGTSDLAILAYSVDGIAPLDRAALALFASSGLN